MKLDRRRKVAAGALVLALFGAGLVWGAADDLWFVTTRRTGEATVLRYVRQKLSFSTSERSKDSVSGQWSDRSALRTVDVMSPVLEFEAGGERVEFTSPGTSLDEPYPIGGRVPIVYSASDPRRAAIAERDESLVAALLSLGGGILALAGALAVMVFFGGWHVHWNRRFPGLEVREVAPL